MTRFEELRIGDFFNIKHGYAFKSEFFADEGDFVLLTPGNFQEFGGLKLKGEKEKYYSASFPEQFLLEAGDIVVAMTDLTQKSPILGAPARIPQSNRYLHNQRLGKVVDLNTSRLDSAYLFFLLSYPPVRGQIKGSATGATVKHTAPDRIRAVVAPVPPLRIQRRIASILSAYDDLIENNTRRIAILEEMARRIYEEWFVRFRFPGHEQVKMVESELGLIPEGWKVQTVEQTFQILGGGTPSKAEPAYWEGGTINWYSPTDLTRAGTSFMEQSADRITALGLAKSSAKLFPPMSVMLTSRATIGVVAINTNEAGTNQGFITCLPNSDYPLWLLYHWLKANVETFIGLGTGATFKEITKGTFKGIRLLVPPQNLVGAFSSTSEQLMLLSLNLQRKNRNLRATRDLLLPKLISGELDVSTLSEPTV